MAKKRFSAEQIVTLLRQIEVLMAQGKSAPEACRDAGYRNRVFTAGARSMADSIRTIAAELSTDVMTEGKPTAVRSLLEPYNRHCASALIG